MKRPKSAIGRRLTAAHVAIQNALSDPELGPPLGAFGFDAARLLEGQAVLDTAEAAVQAQVGTAGGWQAATATLDTAKREARAAYQALAQVVRAAFGRSSAVLAKLGINGPMPTRQGHFLAASTALFVNVASDPDLSAEVARFGYTTKKLASEQAKIEAMVEVLRVREVAKGAAQQATMNQRAAMGDLERWMGAFIRVARVAFRGQDQLMEKLGVLARNAKTEAQRKGPFKAAATRRLNRERLKVVAKKEDDAKAVA
jgi:hypothetical protein